MSAFPFCYPVIQSALPIRNPTGRLTDGGHND
jgi:hypothetical protein